MVKKKKKEEKKENEDPNKIIKELKEQFEIERGEWNLKTNALKEKVERL